MSNYNSIEPTVIDEELLKRARNEQVSPEIAEIARREGIDHAEVTSLRLDYKNILKIDNLWGFENLTKLQLDNNIIERIENIGFLKNLTWLDLSFNNITVIEGLDGLTKLTDLTLYNNRISTITNMDDLINLQVFSIGNNNLSFLENVSYLSKFAQLRVLNLNGNSISKSPNYRSYILAHIRNLKYLDYRLVDDESVKQSKDKYLDDLIAIEEEEKVAISKSDDLRRQHEKDAIHEAAHIRGLDTLFNRMFDEDPDFQRLRPANPTLLQELREDYRVKFDNVENEIRRNILKKGQEKTDELRQYQKCINGAKNEAADESIKLLEAFQHNKKQLIKVVQNSRDTKEVDEALKDLRDSAAQLSDHLVGIEIALVEQIEDVTKDFERNYTEICNSINEYGQTSFARFREMETEYHEKFTENVVALFERINKGDMDELPDELRDIMTDKDVLTNAINGSHDFHLSKVDQQEDNLVSGIGKHLEVTVQEVHNNEVSRNRNKICEIIAFLDKAIADIDQAEENAY